MKEERYERGREFGGGGLVGAGWNGWMLEKFRVKQNRAIEARGTLNVGLGRGS